MMKMMIYDFEPSLNHSNLIYEKKKKKNLRVHVLPFNDTFEKQTPRKALSRERLFRRSTIFAAPSEMKT